jgi:hypothetical protein
VVKAWLKGQIGRANGPTTPQPGATPQETETETNQGLKARANIRAANGTGLQPSEMILHDAPGALPQAGMDCAVGAKVAWKAVERTALLNTQEALLIAERFIGGEIATPKFKTVPLGEIAEIQLGKMLDKAKHQTGKRMPYLRNVNVRWGSIETADLFEMYFEDDELDRFGLAPGDVLVCEGGEPGRAAVWDGRMPDMKFQKALHRVRFKVPFEPKLFVHILQVFAQNGELESRFSGTTIKHLTREVFAKLPIPLPPLEEQRRIVAEIEGYQKEIARLESEIADNRERIQATIDAVWNGDSESANGASPSQPGATPQVTGRKQNEG